MTNDTELFEKLDYLLFELERKEVRRFALEQIMQIAENLIKIAVFGTRSSWGKEFKVKILSIQRTRCNSSSKLLNGEEYFNLIYASYFIKDEKWNKTPVYSMIVELLDDKKYKNYHTPLRYQITENDIQLILFKTEQLMKPISELLSKDEVTNKILEELLKKYVEFWANERGIKRQY